MIQKPPNLNVKKLIVDQNKTIKDALNNITNSGLGACFLTNNGKLSNVVTDGDIRRSLLKGYGLEDKIKNIKTKKFVSVKKTHDFIDLQKKIAKYKLVPIIDDSHKVIDYANEKRFKQIPQSEPVFRGKELEYLTDTIQSGWISSVGKYVNLFEKKFSEFTKSKYSLATSSGTAALQLALSVLKLKKKDEVIVPDFTFVAPINTILHSGAKPVLADIESKTLCISLDSIKKLVNKNTKAVIIVHLYGNTPEIKKIVKFCQKKKIKIIEDCAEAFGTTFNKKHVGKFGDIGTFSFFGNKTITTGEGGILLFKKKEHYQLAKKLRNHGMNSTKKYWHDEVGYNFRMTNMQAAIGLAQLEQANFFVKKKIEIQRKFAFQLRNLSKIDFPKKNKNIKHSHWLTYFRIKNFEKDKNSRNRLLKFLTDKGIEARAGFYSAHTMDIYKKYQNRKLSYKNSLDASKSLISLPSSVNLTDFEINYIADKIKEFFDY